MTDQTTVAEESTEVLSSDSPEPNYLEMLNSYLPDNFKDKKNSLICGKSVPKDPDSNVAYLNIEKLNIGTYQERKNEISGLLMEARLEDNIIAGWNSDTRTFKQARDINELSSILVGDGKAVIGAAGPNVMKHGYKVLEYIMMIPPGSDK